MLTRGLLGAALVLATSTAHAGDVSPDPVDDPALEAWEPEKIPEPEPLPRRSDAAMGGGIALIVFGGVAGVAGITALYLSIDAEGLGEGLSDEEREERVGIGLGFLGGSVLLLALGIPILTYGKQRAVPEVSLGPTGGALRWRF
jgi:hypothetical protein